ncbi:MAG: aminotransferase class I/II-fold pyridoxal phosphate-dependent enzyme [Muribaculaceae bacterium]|nr:aminotransferase class I/II-fold pyridoxal phosphate-dependent enzyme [Muribaculaceae bacterium]
MPTESYRNILSHLQKENRLRSIPLPDPDAFKRLDLVSNDYLGLAQEADKYKAEFFRRFPDADFSSSASRLLSRKNDYHLQLEMLLEKLYRRPALLFNSGYHANVGIIQALAIPGTLFIADKLVHASAIDGLRLCGADYKRFAHNDLKKLSKLIKQNYEEYNRIIVVVESIYSMDGDIAPLKKLVELKKKYPKLLIYVDEAHAFGVRGDRGLGLCEELGIINKVDFIIGTLGKAAASAGAFVISSQLMKDYLLNCARSFIFSTAISPAQAAWSILMIEKIVGMSARRLHLKRLSSTFVKLLSDKANIESPSESQIVPVIIGDAGEALLFSRYLKEQGFDALAIRRPTVAAGSERIRFSLNALLEKDDIARLVSVIANYR